MYVDRMFMVLSLTESVNVARLNTRAVKFQPCDEATTLRWTGVCKVPACP